MATKKKAAKKKATKKKAAKKKGIKASALNWNVVIHGDPPPPWLRNLDVVSQKQFSQWFNAVVKKFQR